MHECVFVFVCEEKERGKKNSAALVGGARRQFSRPVYVLICSLGTPSTVP